MRRKEAERQRARRAKRLSDSADTVRELNRLRQANRRAELSQEQRNAERECVRLYQQERRAERTEEERGADQERVRLYQQERRAERTEEERGADQERVRLYQQERRAERTEEEREAERESVWLYQVERRAEQTEEEREAELERDRLYRVERRTERTEEERETERERDRLYQAERRAQRTEEEQEAERERVRIRRRSKRRGDALANHEDFDVTKLSGPNVVNGRHILPSMFECGLCGACKWPGESPIACCIGGKVKLPPLQRAPGVLRDLYEDDVFRKNIRAYNQVFAFTSVGASRSDRGHVQGVREDSEVQGQRGVYTYRIQGAMGHYLGSMLPYVDRRTGEESAPKFAQIYIVDPDMRHRTERRQGIFSSLDPVHLMDLEDLMARYNPFAQQFLTFGERLREDIASGKEVVDIVYKLHADPRHPGTHNLPTASEVAATMVEDGNLDKHRDLLLYARDRGLLRLFETSPMYDPLQYPLLFPLGDLGWTFTDTYADGNQRRNNTKMSLREHVAFRLFQKPNDGSVLHLGGRLFQQWTVDQQAKAEQERLRWVAGHQKDIRADQYKGFEDALLNESTAGKTHSITKLIVHLDGYQMVLFRADDNPEEVLQRESHTTLTRYFELCASEAPENQVAKRLYYQEIPKLFR
ncbi:hypothetical protein BBJ28_00021640 [Nothophytophthora sp. Chile5]|nr:hypothetical protein BBJ28_00021640 [Nothophytophthora sp. Chile5]